MNKSATNIIVILGIIVTVFGAYFLFTQQSSMFLTGSDPDDQLQQLLISSQLFVERSQTLSEITMDTSIFDDPLFNSLKSFSPKPDEFQVGRPNPFAPTDNSGVAD